MSVLPVLAFWTPSPPEMLVILIVALLLFGKRLPEVARNLGKGVVEFKKGLKGVEDDIDRGNYPSQSPAHGAAPTYGGQQGPSTGHGAGAPASPASASPASASQSSPPQG